MLTASTATSHALSKHSVITPVHTVRGTGNLATVHRLYSIAKSEMGLLRMEAALDLFEQCELLLCSCREFDEEFANLPMYAQQCKAHIALASKGRTADTGACREIRHTIETACNPVARNVAKMYAYSLVERKIYSVDGLRYMQRYELRRLCYECGFSVAHTSQLGFFVLGEPTICEHLGDAIKQCGLDKLKFGGVEIKSELGANDDE